MGVLKIRATVLAAESTVRGLRIGCWAASMRRAQKVAMDGRTCVLHKKKLDLKCVTKTDKRCSRESFSKKKQEDLNLAWPLHLRARNSTIFKLFQFQIVHALGTSFYIVQFFWCVCLFFSGVWFVRNRSKTKTVCRAGYGLIWHPREGKRRLAPLPTVELEQSTPLPPPSPLSFERIHPAMPQQLWRQRGSRHICFQRNNPCVSRNQLRG